MKILPEGEEVKTVVFEILYNPVQISVEHSEKSLSYFVTSLFTLLHNLCVCFVAC